ncbi:MAG TPA: hypothetical protein VLV45_15225 [Gemmatimonadales bacterium]|nr:hypothetical protein [Gemmatimonadales bacterium]
MASFTETVPAELMEPREPEPSARLGETLRRARHKRRALGALAIAGAVVGIAVALLLPRRWTASASFFPESRGSPDLTSNLGGLAGLAGLMGGSLSIGTRPAVFFTDLAKSRSFFDSIAVSTVRVDTPDVTMRVEDYLIKKAKTPALRRWRARAALKSAVKATMLPSGVVVITVKAKSPYAAAAIANRAIEVIDELNIDFRRREAAARRKFTEGFLDIVQQHLTDAQNRLVQFLNTNRTFVAPALQQQQRSLENEVERLTLLQQQLETSIENARLTEYNDAPMVTTVDVAAVPARPSGVPRILFVIGMMFLTLIGGLWAIHLRLWR